MPALAFTPVMPYGKRTVTTAGTPQVLFTAGEVPRAAAGIWTTRVIKLRIEALNSNTGLIYIGVSTMNKTTLVGVMVTLSAPGGNPIVNAYEFDRLAPGGNLYELQNFWIDADVSGEGVLRTVWVA